MKKLINAIVQWAYKWAKASGIIVLVMCMVGCSADAVNNKKCLEAAKRTFPQDSVYELIGKDYHFIVQTKEGKVMLVKTMHVSDAEVSGTYPALQLSTMVIHDTVYIPVPSESHSQIK